MLTCKQCKHRIVCGKNKKHLINSQTVVIFITRIHSVKHHKKYHELKDAYEKQCCKVLCYETYIPQKKKLYKKIKHAILRSGGRITNIIIYFWEDENAFDYKTMSLHPNIILKDLSDQYPNKRWFLISNRITNNRGARPPKIDFGTAFSYMGYLDVKTRNEDECLTVLENMHYWSKLDELIATCRKLRCVIQHAGRLLDKHAVF